MQNSMSIEQLRNMLDRFIDTYGLTDTEIVRIVENEALNRHSVLNSSILLERGIRC